MAPSPRTGRSPNSSPEDVSWSYTSGVQIRLKADFREEFGGRGSRGENRSLVTKERSPRLPLPFLAIALFPISMPFLLIPLYLLVGHAANTLQ